MSSAELSTELPSGQTPAEHSLKQAFVQWWSPANIDKPIFAVESTAWLSRIDNIVRIVVAVAFAAVLVRVIVSPLQTQNLAHSQTLVSALWGACLIGAWWLLRGRLRRAGGWLDDHTVIRRWILWGSQAVVTVAALGWSAALYQPYHGGWDVDVVTGAAHEWAVNGTFVDPHVMANNDLDYFGTFPNNIGILNLLRWIYVIAGPRYANSAVLLLGVVLAGVVVMMAYDLVRRICGTGYAIVCAVLMWILVGFNPWICVPYTDTFGLIFPVATLWLLAKLITARSWRDRIVLAIVCGLVAGTGMQIKVTTGIVVIAACCVSLAFFLFVRSHRKKAIAVFAVLALCGAGTYSALGAVFHAALPAEAAQSEPYPLEYFVLTGLSESADGYGAFDFGTAILMQSTNSKAERQELGREAISDRLDELGPLGYAEFLYDKAVWVYSDATFWSFGEGGNSQDATFKYSGGIAQFIQNLARPFGTYNLIWATFLQGIWLAALMKTLCALLRRAPGVVDVFRLTMVVAVLGFTGYQLLFEARPRYLFLFVPVIVILAFSGLNAQRQKLPQS